ncbi:hypothetical protein HZA97_07890 [Candidatus Woesearchaeota archaeon]|nr:hypothetical protein [Candidatus Woesearchaeota archaeon]
MNKIILIGGSPTAGKSYTARKIAEELKLPWISTDTIREQMRELVRKTDYPALFLHSESTPKLAVKFLTSNTAEEIVNLHNKENKEVWKGVKALIETDYVWKSFIVEGVAILPHLVAKLVKKNKNVKAVFLVDEDLDRVRKTIFTRGLWDEASKYPDSVKEKEVEWVAAFNDFIKKEAKKHKLPVVSVGNRKNYLKEIKRILKK